MKNIQDTKVLCTPHSYIYLSKKKNYESDISLEARLVGKKESRLMMSLREGLKEGREKQEVMAFGMDLDAPFWMTFGLNWNV